MPIDLLKQAYRNHYQLSPHREVSVDPIKKGASGRTITRVRAEESPDMIGIHYNFDRSDNDLHKPVSDFLESVGVQVPAIEFADLESQILLVRDVGKIDLLSLKEESWSVREPYYRKAFEQLKLISEAEPPKDLKMMPPFTEETYLWEQRYFAEHFVERHLKKDGKAFLVTPVVQALAEELGGDLPDLVHRDFQSQNLMLHEGQVYVIDFQGARKGYVEYDLASFIYDPYMRHPLEEREKLRSLWEEVKGAEINTKLIRKCALQRLMQALGAYGNIVYNQGNQWYAQHIEPACEMLISLTGETEYEEVFHPLLKEVVN